MTSVPHSADLPVRTVSLDNVSYHAYRTLQFAFVVAPILAGIDKFFHVLCDWDKYLAPWISHIFNNNTHGFMMAVGIIEIIAGIGVAIKPKYFGYVVGLWLCGIVINLLSMGAYFDIALRDVGLALAAFSLARLAMFFDIGQFGGLMARRA